MVTRQTASDDHLPPHDPWRLPVVLLSWLVLLGIAWQVMGALQARNRFTRDLSRAEQVGKTQPVEGARLALLTLAAAQASQRGLAERFLALIKMPPPNYTQLVADRLARLGDYYYANRQEDAGSRALTQSLLLFPEQPDLGEMLGEMCIHTRSYELGYQGALLAERHQSSMASMLLTHFGKRVPNGRTTPTP